jgi:hypothetical protein
VLVPILPPLLYLVAYNTSLRDLRQNVVQISALPVGLVAATTAGSPWRRTNSSRVSGTALARPATANVANSVSSR